MRRCLARGMPGVGPRHARVTHQQIAGLLEEVVGVVAGQESGGTQAKAAGGGKRVLIGDRAGLTPAVQERLATLGVEPMRAGDVMHSVASIAYAEDLLGYRPIVEFKEGLARTVEAAQLTVLMMAI